MGAAEVVNRSEFSSPGKPLAKERFAGVVDSVGSHTLANACAATRYRGAVAACGLAQGMDFPGSVAPFILRGITLYGIDSVMAPLALREQAWAHLAVQWDAARFAPMVRRIGLVQAVAAGADILAGRVKGRLVVDALLARVDLARIDAPRAERQPKLPAALVAEAKAACAQADRDITDGYERQAVITLAAHLLGQAGLWKESDALLQANLAKSHSPYYLMSQLGGNARKLGKAQEALKWFEQAYVKSVGPATRLQWGASYLTALVELAPKEHARIEQAASSVLKDAEGQSAAFYERSDRSLKRAGDVELHEVGPVLHHEEVGIGHAEGVAHQVLLAFQLAVHPLQAAQQAFTRHGLGFLGHAGGEQGREALVQFGADDVEPALQAVARHGAVGRGQLLGGHLVGDVLHDGRAFGQAFAVVQFQQRHIAQRVDAVGQLLRLGAGHHRGEGQAGFAQHDVRAEGAGAGAVIQLHEVTPERGLGLGCYACRPMAAALFRRSLVVCSVTLPVLS
ncbi:hypothetical protein B566_EDAN018407 [Ephemera danica]|nr:hypothetical protein B566_EDAN018407 [Ephemera danica]